MRRSDARRQNNAVVVTVCHNDCAHHARCHAPARGPAKFLFAFTCLELNSARTGKILPEKMRCAGLDRFAVLHHCFECHSFHRARELFAIRL